MSDVSSGARAPDDTYGVDVPARPVADPAAPRPYPSGGLTGDKAPDDRSTAKQVAGQSVQAAGQAASDVKDTATGQAQRVGAEARAQVRNVATDVRDRVREQARTQNGRLVSTIRRTADQLDEMSGDRPDSPAATMVTRVADGGRQLADYLDRNGPEGLLREVQDFARRRPGAFLATAVAAGFVVGRLGKGVAKADPGAGVGKPSSDAFVSARGAGQTPGDRFDVGTAGYGDPPIGSRDTTVSTEYAATGTGTPVAVEEAYVLENPEDRR
jgi:uncharacterized protein YjbJ (UPF0337 family)